MNDRSRYTYTLAYLTQRGIDVNNTREHQIITGLPRYIRARNARFEIFKLLDISNNYRILP